MNRLRLCFPGLRADAFLVTHLPNVQYLTGFSGSAALLLVDSSHGALFTDSRYTIQAHQEVSGARVVIAKKGLIRELGRHLGGRRGRMRIAYEPAHLTMTQKAALDVAGGSRIRWVSASDAIERLRAVKDGAELEAIRAAARLITEVVRRVLPAVRPGISELEVAGRLEYSMKRLGASGASFETIVASGPRSAWPHARASSKLLRKNELVVLDQGAILRSYCSDMTRTVFLGRAPAKIRRLYQAVLEAQEAAKAAIRPGKTAGEVDLAARRVLKRHRLAKYFTHSTGHGLGLEVHEMPRLGRGEKTILETGMVLTVEPGIYIEGLGGIRIEDDVVVTPAGAETLTTAPREFLEL